MLDRFFSGEFKRYFRKGLDFLERGYRRFKIIILISSSCSERSYNVVRFRKLRRMFYRNVVYVKFRKNKNYKFVERK